MAKTKHSSSYKEKSPIKTFRDSAEFYSNRVRPVSDAFLEKTADYVKEWSSREDSFTFNQFFVETGITDSDYNEWKEKNEKLKEFESQLTKEKVFLMNFVFFFSEKIMLS